MHIFLVICSYAFEICAIAIGYIKGNLAVLDLK